MLIDTHTHLTDNRIDSAKVIADMSADGLEKLITVGYDLRSSLGGLEIASQSDNVYCALGIHPSDAVGAATSDVFRLAKDMTHPKVVAAGEIGLDYHYADTDRERQKEILILQLETYAPFGLPFIFHLRDAYEDMYKILSQRKSLFGAGAVMHCFSGSLETAVSYADMGFYISFSGTVTYPNAKKFTEIVRALPRGRLLIETDCPYLAPQPVRGKTNEPRFVRYQAQKLAEILDESVEDIEKLTTANAYALFRKMK